MELAPVDPVPGAANVLPVGVTALELRATAEEPPAAADADAVIPTMLE
jgi:hypothetical protein